MEITSTSNSRVKEWKKLNTKKGRKRQNKYILDGKIYLLPALPDKWSEGSVRGLLAKGNIKVDMTWSGGKLTSYSLTGNGEAHIVYGGQETVHRLDGGTLTVEL